MRMHIANLCLLLLILSACQLKSDASSPEILWGVWKSSAPQYETSSLKIKKGWIIFEKDSNYFNANKITQIEEYPEGERTLYNIHYNDGDSGEYILSLYYFQTEDKKAIRFKNQEEITWLKVNES